MMLAANSLAIANANPFQVGWSRRRELISTAGLFLDYIKASSFSYFASEELQCSKSKEAIQVGQILICSKALQWKIANQSTTTETVEFKFKIV